MGMSCFCTGHELGRHHRVIDKNHGHIMHMVFRTNTHGHELLLYGTRIG